MQMSGPVFYYLAGRYEDEIAASQLQPHAHNGSNDYCLGHKIKTPGKTVYKFLVFHTVFIANQDRGLQKKSLCMKFLASQWSCILLIWSIKSSSGYLCLVNHENFLIIVSSDVKAWCRPTVVHEASSSATLEQDNSHWWNQEWHGWREIIRFV